METFTEPSGFVDDPGYAERRKEALAALDPSAIDKPIAGIVEGFTRVPHCYTLQSCCGHFVHAGNSDPRNIEPLPAGTPGTIRYRIAYFAFCVQNSAPGRALRDLLERVPAVAPENIQFGSARWFLERCPNSYVLQVEPYRFRYHDEAMLERDEALRVQRCRDLFLAKLEAVLQQELLR